ncbi:MAG: sugar ABC transporter permease, partial [Anaerolineae bacterium]
MIGPPARTAGRLLLVGLFTLPLLFMALAAFRPTGQAITAGLWPNSLTLDNFRRLFAALP